MRPDADADLMTRCMGDEVLGRAPAGRGGAPPGVRMMGGGAAGERGPPEPALAGALAGAVLLPLVVVPHSTVGELRGGDFSDSSTGDSSRMWSEPPDLPGGGTSGHTTDGAAVTDNGTTGQSADIGSVYSGFCGYSYITELKDNF